MKKPKKGPFELPDWVAWLIGVGLIGNIIYHIFVELLFN